MTSLNTTTGWDANKQTGSNLTHSSTQESSEAGKGRDGRGSHILRNVTPTSTPSSSTVSSSGYRPGGSLESTTNEIDVMRQREEFYNTKYDPMTGVRIASTLGGFFLIVLLTLLYKSKCKHKDSREPSMLTLNNLGYPTGHAMRGQNIQVNGRPDFGGGSGGDDAGASPGVPMSLTLLDSSCYGYMNQVHPANSHQPIFSNCYSADYKVRNPAVLLTAANSESSDEDVSLISGTGEIHQHGPQVPSERKRTPLGPLPPCRQVMTTSERGESQHHLLPRCKSPPRIGGGRGNIDINVILPTPSISPSGSEHFNVTTGAYFGGGSQTHTGLFPRVSAGARGGGVVGSGAAERRRLLVSRSLSSDNENDNSEMSGVGDGSDSEAAMLPFGCGRTSLFSLDNLKYVDDTSSENIPTRASDGDEQEDQDTRSIGSDSVFACFEHNFDHIAPTYARRVSSVSGTSSGMIVLHSAPPPPPPPPPQQTSPPSQSTSPTTATTELVKVTGGGSCGYGEGDDTEFRVTLTQAHAQVHHRDSFCSDLESVNDYMETGARRRSSSTQTTLSDMRQALGYSPTQWGAGEGGTISGPGASPGATSFASYSGQREKTPPKLFVAKRRRSLSPHNVTRSSITAAQTTTATISDLSLPVGSCAVSPRSTSHYLSVTVHPPPLAGSGGPGDALTPTTPTNPPPPPPPSSMTMLSPTSALAPIPPSSRLIRQRSFEALRKSLSLQCEEKTEASSLYIGSSNETTPTN